MKTDTPKPKSFLRLPNGEALRTRLILRLIPLGPEERGDNYASRPAIKLMLAAGQKTVCRFESAPERDTALNSMLETLS